MDDQRFLFKSPNIKLPWRETVGVQIGQREQLLAQRPHYTRLHQGSRLSLDLPSVGYSTGHCIKSPGPQRVPRTCSYATKTFKVAAILSLKWIRRLLSPTALISQTTEDGASNFHRGSRLLTVLCSHNTTFISPFPMIRWTLTGSTLLSALLQHTEGESEDHPMSEDFLRLWQALTSWAPNLKHLTSPTSFLRL